MRTICCSIFIALLFIKCSPKSNGNKIVETDSINNNNLNYTVIQYDSTLYWLFKNSIQTDLNKEEIENVTKILNDCLSHHNSNLKTSNKRSKSSNRIEIEDYKVQLVPILNDKGEKEVWVNCFCGGFNDQWKKHIVFVLDGGKCYFNLKINLTLKKYYEFQVNGVA